MLKPDDPVWAELVAEIKAVMSSSCDDGYAFTSSHRCDQWDFFNVSGFSARYVDQGMTEAQVTTIIQNALDGKPQENWLDGVFDGQALENQKTIPTNPMPGATDAYRLMLAEAASAAAPKQEKDIER